MTDDPFTYQPDLISMEAELAAKAYRSELAKLRADLTALVNAPADAAIAAAIVAYFLSLPTTLPATAGVVWNNGGTVSIS